MLGWNAEVDERRRSGHFTALFNATRAAMIVAA